MNRLLDLSFIIGLFFLVIGILLIGYSFLAVDANIEVNGICGFLFAMFGLVMMLWLSGNKK